MDEWKKGEKDGGIKGKDGKREEKETGNRWREGD